MSSASSSSSPRSQPRLVDNDLLLGGISFQSWRVLLRQLASNGVAPSERSQNVALEHIVRRAQQWQLRLLKDHETLIRSDSSCLLDSLTYLLCVEGGHMTVSKWHSHMSELSARWRRDIVKWLRDNAGATTPDGIPISEARLHTDESWTVMCDRFTMADAWLEPPALYAIAALAKRPVVIVLDNARGGASHVVLENPQSANNRAIPTDRLLLPITHGDASSHSYKIRRP